MSTAKKAITHRRVKQAILNLAWLWTTLWLLAVVAYVWPYKTWLWGMVLGSGVGGGSVMVVAYVASWMGVSFNE